MKQIVLIVILTIITTSFTVNNNHTSESILTIQSNFCEGWTDGYCEGWKDVKGQFALCPMTPLCPVPYLGQDTYRAGYNRGFKAGTRAAEDYPFN